MRILLYSMVVLMLMGCPVVDQPPIERQGERLRFVDLIDHHGVPVAAEDWSLMPFADQGAWFGFALPPDDGGDRSAGFTGPFVMTGGRWISPMLAGIELPGAELVRAEGLPGLLTAEWRVRDIVLEQTLWFHSSKVAMVRSEIRNTGVEPWSRQPEWTGRVFDGAAEIEGTTSGVSLRSSGGDIVRVVADGAVSEIVIEGDVYRMPLASIVSLEPGESTTLNLAISMTPAGDAEPDVSAALVDPDASLAMNADRWSGYVDATSPAGEPDDPSRVVAIKAIQTLIGNWRGPAGRFAHGGLFPSSNVWYFNGFWAWDSWKHAVALARIDPAIAADQLRLMAGQQDESGMIADVVYLDPEEDNWRDTKPPLLGWALGEVYEANGDLDLVRELYPGLVQYHEFWYAHRDHDGDGLCEYGSTDGTIVAARWESGMDNAVRFDDTGMLQNGAKAWSMDQESVDLNSYLYREKVALYDLAVALSSTEDAERWAAEAATLRAKIQQTMFDEGSGWFYDTTIETGEIIPVQGPEGWIPLWAGVATRDQAARVRTTMLDPEVFRTHVPFPTVAANHPEFSDGYWRGLVWLDQVFFAIEGLRAYGYGDDADELTAQVLANLEGAAVPGFPLHENYDPLTGGGRNVRHFSWTAAHLLLLTADGR